MLRLMLMTSRSSACASVAEVAASHTSAGSCTPASLCGTYACSTPERHEWPDPSDAPSDDSPTTTRARSPSQCGT
jgi:hypothetical protein